MPDNTSTVMVERRGPGATPKLTPEQEQTLVGLYNQREPKRFTVDEIRAWAKAAFKVEISRRTFFNILDRHDPAKQNGPPGKEARTATQHEAEPTNVATPQSSTGDASTTTAHTQEANHGTTRNNGKAEADS